MPSLIEHHNACARYVGLLIQFVVGGRDRHLIDFRASVWSSTTTFGLMEEALSAGADRSPSIPALRQLKLWHAHIARWISAIEIASPRLFAPFNSSARSGNSRTCPCFLLDAWRPRPLELRCPFCRPSQPAQPGLWSPFSAGSFAGCGMPFEDIQTGSAISRRESQRTNWNSNRVKYHSTERLISGIDQVLLELNIRPGPA